MQIPEVYHLVQSEDLQYSLVVFKIFTPFMAPEIKVKLATLHIITRKRFSEKPIIVVTSSTVFILDFYVYMTKSVWSNASALIAWILKLIYM